MMLSLIHILQNGRRRAERVLTGGKEKIMYLHLGQDCIIRTKEILGIFDLDSATLSKHTRDYLTRAEKEGRVSM